MDKSKLFKLPVQSGHSPMESVMRAIELVRRPLVNIATCYISFVVSPNSLSKHDAPRRVTRFTPEGKI